MNLTFCELYPSSAVNDAVLVPNFLEGLDVLAVAQGNRLVVYPIQDGYLAEPKFYVVYGNIWRLAPVGTSYSATSSLVVLLSDMRTCVLQYSESEGEIVTLGSGNLTQLSEVDLIRPRFATHPTVVIAQVGPRSLNVFPIDSNSFLEAPFPVQIGCREIIDFAFVGPVSKVTRLIVLTREFNGSALLRAIDVEPLENSYVEDQKNWVAVPDDAVSVVPFEPDSQSIVIVFSGQKAIRVAYNVGLTPQVTTATIRTPWPLQKMTAMDRNFYIAVEEKSLALRAAKIEEMGIVNFVNVGSAPEPTALVPVTQNLAFIGSAKEDSVLVMVSQNEEHPTASVFSTIKATGKVNSFLIEENKVITVFARAIAETKEMIPFRALLKVECAECTRHWGFVFRDNPCCVVTNGLETFVFESKDVAEYEEMRDGPFVLDRPTIYASGAPNSNVVQVVDNGIHLFSSAARIDTCACDGVICAASAGSFLAVATQDTVMLYDMLSNISLLRKHSLAGMCTAVAINAQYIAVATTAPSTITWFSIDKGVETRRTMLGDELIIGLEFDAGSSLIAVRPQGNILKITDDQTEEIYCEGSHTGISMLNGSCFIGGEIPHLLQNGKAIPVRAPKWTSATVVDDQICGLAPDALWFGHFSRSEFSSRTYTSETQVLGVYKMDRHYITARQLQSGVGLFISWNKFDSEEASLFYTFGPDESFVGFASEDENLFVCSSAQLSRFIIRGGQVRRVGGVPFSQRLMSFGKFRTYYCFQYQTSIEFLTINVRNETNCAVSTWFTLDNRVPIECCAFDNQTAVIVGPERVLSAYSFDQYRDTFIPIGRHTSPCERICSVCVVDSVIFAGTNNGNVLAIEFTAAGSANQVELEVVNSFTVDDPVTAMTGCNGTAYIGTEAGLVTRVKPFSPTTEFRKLYKTLAARVCSLGWFAKTQQRCSRHGNFYTSRKPVCDMETLRAFLDKSETEQQEILRATGIELPDALQLIKSVFMC